MCIWTLLLTVHNQNTPPSTFPPPALQSLHNTHQFHHTSRQPSTSTVHCHPTIPTFTLRSRGGGVESAAVEGFEGGKKEGGVGGEVYSDGRVEGLNFREVFEEGGGEGGG